MNSFKKLTCAVFALSILAFSSCKKDPEPEPVPVTPPATTGSISLEFENMVGDSTLVFNTQSYVTTANDTFTVTKFMYYISNIVFTKSNGDTFAEPESYHLIDASDEATGLITISNIPLGNYTSVSFLIGVDSARNVSGAQTGALDPLNGMFWSWSTGYIMTKLEGTSPQSTGSGNLIMYHQGGFSGMYSSLRHVTPSFGGDMAILTSTWNPEIHIKADLLAWFSSPHPINIAATSFNMSVNATSSDFADNQANMYTVEHIHNN